MPTSYHDTSADPLTGSMDGASRRQPGPAAPPAHEQLGALLRQELQELVDRRERLAADISRKRQQLLLLADVVLLGGNRQAARSGREISIKTVGLNVRTMNCLINGGIRTLDDLAQRTEEELMQLRNFGQGCLEDVNRVLAEHGMSLRRSGCGPDGEVTGPSSVARSLRDSLDAHTRDLLATVQAAHGKAPLAGVERLMEVLNTPIADTAELWQLPPDDAIEHASGLVGLASRMARGERVSPLEELSLAIARGVREDREMAVRYMGLDGSPPDTLEAISAANGVTRERVRQRVERFRVRILGSRPPLPFSEAVVAALQPGRAYALGEWRDALPATLGPERAEHLMILSAMESWGWLPAFAVHEHGYGVLVAGGRDMYGWLSATTREAMQLLRPHRALGAVSPAHLAYVDDQKLELLRAVLRSDSRWTALGDEWFIIRNARKSLIGSRARRMLGLLGPLTMADLRHGLRRDMKRSRAVRTLTLPPRQVLGRILRRAGCDLSSETGYVTLRIPPVEQVGSRMDRALLSAFADGREAVTTRDLDDAMLASGLSIASGRHAGTVSPLLFRERHGVYSLLGRRASAGAVGEAQDRIRPEPAE